MPVELTANFVANFITKSYQKQTGDPNWVTLIVYIILPVRLPELKVLVYKSLNGMCQVESS